MNNYSFEYPLRRDILELMDLAYEQEDFTLLYELEGEINE